MNFEIYQFREFAVTYCPLRKAKGQGKRYPTFCTNIKIGFKILELCLKAEKKTILSNGEDPTIRKPGKQENKNKEMENLSN